MKYLALAVVLAVIQTSAPVPRKTPSNGMAQKVTKQSGSDKTPAQQVPSIAQPIGTQPNQDTSHSPATENTQKPVLIRELPPVSVTKDWLDKTYIAFTGILIIVGIIGVRAAYKTLGEIKSQREAMQGQLTAMQGQLDAMTSSGKQTDKLIEQAEKQAKALIDAVDLQEANFQQWVDIAGWTAKLSGDHEFYVGFNLLNSSDWPLTVVTTHIRVAHTDSLRKHDISLTPKQAYSVVCTNIPVSDEWYNQFLSVGAILPVYVKITYVNCLRRTVPQEFTGLITCAPTWTNFRLLDLPDIRVGLQNEAQNPN